MAVNIFTDRLRPASPDEAVIFYALPPEQAHGPEMGGMGL